jgi:GTP diphosphokinase / guanosine-3',5'-bis(diphosphate) 3'-diphosphatase
MPTLNDVLEQARHYLPEEDLSPLQRAYDHAAKIHAGQKHASGEPYISHLLEVAHILATMHLDLTTLIAGLLHGSLKAPGTPLTEKELEELFGKDVATIVSGATRITKVNFDSRLAYQAENVRKMLVAMAADIRVLLLKLADRLHDMRHLQNFENERQEEFARETMDLYAPLASRLGIDWMKRELEDLSFAYLHPREYAELSTNIESSTLDRQAYVEAVKELLSTKIKEYGITDFRILGRPKHLYSIYKKLIAQKIPLEKVYDKVAFRVIVTSVKECYEVLGMVHSLWRPVDGRFKDFISSPKPNMYQSLHTSVVGPYGEFMEIQIRTEEMDRIAQEGIAAHWAYKEGKAASRKDAEMFNWFKQLIQWLQELKDPKEFLEAVKTELHDSDVYVLTPRGEVKEITQGATPLDFAYSIHTEVGDHCVGAKVNGRIVPLRYQLKNGDLVEIITSPNQRPNRGWLAMVRTSRARSRIRQWLKKEEQERDLKLGQEICDRELRKHDLTLKKLVRTGHLQEILKALACSSVDDLLRRIGNGRIGIDAVVRVLQPPEMQAVKETPAVEQAAELEAVRKKTRSSGQEGAIVIDGVEGVLATISKCCMPVPGDAIKGYITAGRGITVHKTSCLNFQATDPVRHISVKWAPGARTAHRTHVLITAQNQKGLIAALTNAIAAKDADILDMEAHSAGGNLTTISVVLEISSLEHLARLLQHLRQVEGVLEAKRK